MDDNPLRVDTGEWSVFVKEQLAARDLTPETAARPAGPFPAGVATIRRWRENSGQVVSVDKVFEVADALDYPVVRLLVRLGLIKPEDVGVVGLASTEPALAPIVRRVQGLLDNTRIPSVARDWLATLIESTVTFWWRSVGVPAAKKEAPRARGLARPSVREDH